MKVFHDIFTKLQWFGIYYFILEVFDVKNKLQSQSIEEYHSLARTHRRRNLIVISTIVIFELIQILFDIEERIGVLNIVELDKVAHWFNAVA